MLKQLDIKDFALIEDVSVSFTSGLNVLTGETGAGKSIIIDAINAVLGGKVGPSAIRLGAEKSQIEACFLATPPVAGWLKQQQLQDDDSETFVISREINKSATRMRINGTLVNSAVMQELRQALLTIHAQHEARTLMSSTSQLEMLDSLGDKDHKKLQDRLKTMYAARRELASDLNELSISEDERVRRLDFARFQLHELTEAALAEADEDEKLAVEVKRLSNVANLETTCLQAQEALNGQEGGAYDLLQTALQNVEEAAEMDSNLAGALDALKGVIDTVEETARTLRRYREGLEADPEALNELEARLAQLATIKRKYGPTLIDAISRRDSLAEEIERLDNAHANQESLRKELQELDKKLYKVASELSVSRQKKAKELATAITKDLAQLGMERCLFEVSFAKGEEKQEGDTQFEVGPHGIDRIEFMICPNPGQPLMPVAKIASGGELSRVMLAIKSHLANNDHVSSVVFDEIETGLSGKTLKAMRDKLANLSCSHQILCITHQPLIAAIADNHVHVNKKVLAKTTNISVQILTEPERIAAVAGMASGQENQAEAISFARSLFSEAGQLKASFK
jgi:DNA repair protein RecN (Recombination protein N)